MTESYYSIENVRQILGIPEPLVNDATLINLIDKAHHDAGQFCEKNTEEYECRFKESLMESKR